MARHHRRLRVFNEAHRLVLAIYRETHNFPREEWFGLRAQMRRASVSVASNLVEGSARRRSREYVHFTRIRGGSDLSHFACIGTWVSFSRGKRAAAEELRQVGSQLESLVQKLELLIKTEDEHREGA